jgi:succinylglutamate desuccinylase
MIKPLFRHSFLKDTLDVNNPMPQSLKPLSNGVICRIIAHGVLEVTPAAQNAVTKSIVLSSGIHGDETAPMELLDQLVSKILNEEIIPKHRLLIIFAHPQATNMHTRLVVHNLNRLFDEMPDDDSIEVQIAKNIKQWIVTFYHGTKPSQRWHLDLHCAIRGSKHYTFAVSPKVANKVRGKELIEFLEAAKIEALLLSNAPSATCSWYTAHQFGAKALTVELGKVAPLWKNDLQKLQHFYSALINLLTDNSSQSSSSRLLNYKVNRTITRHYDDFKFTFSSNVENFTSYPLGQVIGHDGEQILVTKVNNEAVVFPNANVEIGQRAALMVCEVKTRYEDDELVYDY